MALQNIGGGGLALPSYHHLRLALGTASNILDVIGEKLACVFKVPKTGSIVAVGCRTGTVSGSGLSVSAGLETLSSGDPSGTAYGGSVAGSFTPTTNAFFEITLGTAASATIGDDIAVVFNLTAGTTPSVNIPATNDASSGSTTVFPYIDTYNGTVWTKSSTTILISWIKYSDGTYEYTGMSPFIQSTSAFNNGSTPDEYALYMNLTAPCRTVGFWLYANFPAATDIVLYDSGSTALRTNTLNVSNLSGATGYHVYPWSGGKQTLAAGVHRLSVKPTTTTNITIYKAQVYSAAISDAWLGGQNFKQSSRTDGGSWTEDGTLRLMGGLIIDQLDDGAGGGGGMMVHPGMTGGVRG